MREIRARIEQAQPGPRFSNIWEENKGKAKANIEREMAKAARAEAAYLM